MISFDVQWIDVKPFLLSGVQPVFIFHRPKAHHQGKSWAGNTQIAHLGDFWVPQGPILSDDMGWAVTRTGESVRVPVFAYKTQRALASLVGVGVQIGLAALADLRNHTNDVPSTATLILGHECTDLTPAEDSFRCYVGIAVRTK